MWRELTILSPADRCPILGLVCGYYTLILDRLKFTQRPTLFSSPKQLGTGVVPNITVIVLKSAFRHEELFVVNQTGSSCICSAMRNFSFLFGFIDGSGSNPST